jgi:YVTN family beta-propeller protein
MYAQLSEYHGVVEVGLPDGRILRSRDLPIDEGVTEDDYDFEAPHHGLALSRDEKTLCLAGRASDYVALVSTNTLEPEAIIEVDDAPGWAAVTPDGRHCFVANTRADTISVISFAEQREVTRIKAGDGPKLIEAARLPAEVVCTSPEVPGCAPRIRLRQRCGRGDRLRVRLAGDVAGVRRVVFRVGRRTKARDRAAPFGWTVGRGALARWRGRKLTALIELAGAPDVTRSARLRDCT